MLAASRPVRSSLSGLTIVAMLSIGQTGCSGRDDSRSAKTGATPTQRAALPDDIEAQVHSFCGAACHPYPSPDTFPRHHWRTEVERGFRFFDKSGALAPPKLRPRRPVLRGTRRSIIRPRTLRPRPNH